MVFIYLHVAIYFLDIIKKYYNKLYQSIPLDYEKSISKLLHLNLLTDDALELIYSTENKNETIINILISS